MICGNELCKKEFEPTDGRQKYCCRECKDRARRLRGVYIFPTKESTKHVEYKCDRLECRFYRMTLANHCDALAEVYTDSSKCKFFKERS